jgi:glycosyltransferase involved in cell wall biosynthesis
MRIKKYSEKNILVRFFRKMERKVYKGCTKVVTISNDMKNTLISHGVDKNKIDVIYNWVDIDRIINVDRINNELFDNFNLSRDKFYISYAGDIGLFQKWDLIIDVAAILEKEFPEIEFVIIGNGSYKNKLLNEIKTRSVPNIKVFPLQPMRYISSAYSLGDIEFVSLETDVTKIALPSKIGQILSVGAPILGLFDYDSDIAKTINNNGLGVVPMTLEPIVVAKEIISLYKNNHILRTISDNSRAYAEKNLDRKKQTKKYYDLLLKIKSGEEY